MQVLIAFLVITFILGGTERGYRLQQRPVFLLGYCTVFALSFYSLRVVL